MAVLFHDLQRVHYGQPFGFTGDFSHRRSWREPSPAATPEAAGSSPVDAAIKQLHVNSAGTRRERAISPAVHHVTFRHSRSSSDHDSMRRRESITPSVPWLS